MRATVVAEQLLQSDLPEVVRRVIDAARGGDMTAAKLILERLVPVRRGAPVHVKLPEVKCARDLVAAAAAITAEVAAGAISPDEGVALTAVVDFQRKAIETSVLEARLYAVEERMELDGTA